MIVVQNTMQKEIMYLDVRSPEEFIRGSVDGAINIPLHLLPLRMSELKDKKVIVFCASGMRSSMAYSFLQKEGVDVEDGCSVSLVQSKK
jgi:phage shock protein E